MYLLGEGADMFVMGIISSIAGFLALTIAISVVVVFWKWLKD
jgi:hypothetical protein